MLCNAVYLLAQSQVVFQNRIFFNQGDTVAFEFRKRAPQLQVGVNARLENGRVGWFGDKVHRTHRKTFGHIGGFTHCRQKNHGHVGTGGIGLDLAADLKTVHLRHHHVQQNEVRNLSLPQDLQGALATAGDLDLVVIAQQFHHDIEVVGHVVDHQQGGFAGRVHHRPLRLYKFLAAGLQNGRGARVGAQGLGPGLFNDSPDLGLKRPDAERLDHVTRHPRLNGDLHLVPLGLGGHHEHWQVGMPGAIANLLQQVQPVHHWHVPV